MPCHCNPQLLSNMHRPLTLNVQPLCLNIGSNCYMFFRLNLTVITPHSSCPDRSFMRNKSCLGAKKFRISRINSLYVPPRLNIQIKVLRYVCIKFNIIFRDLKTFNYSVFILFSNFLKIKGTQSIVHIRPFITKNRLVCRCYIRIINRWHELRRPTPINAVVTKVIPESQIVYIRFVFQRFQLE